MGDAAAAGVARAFGRGVRVDRARFFGQAPGIPPFSFEIRCPVGRVIKTTSSRLNTTITIILQRINTHASKSAGLSNGFTGEF
jgi:hypothetical protein